MKRMFVAALFTVVSSVVLQAQTSLLKTTIPFEFRIGKSVLPAGQYAIEDRTSYMLVRQIDKGEKKSVVVLTHPADPNGASEKSHLTFHRYGDQYFLRQVWAYGNGKDLPKTPQERSREKELAWNRGSGMETVALYIKHE
jgi:hypothetical protein